MADCTVVVVSGLPRSGTSMMMRMLEAGGLPPLTDGVRRPDPDNPGGYYEFEAVKALARDASWVPDARGKAVKVISYLLHNLPNSIRDPDSIRDSESIRYKVVFMRRAIDEVVASQDRMLARAGKSPASIGTNEIATYLERNLGATRAWLAAQSNFEVLYVDYSQTVGDAAATCRRVKAFLGVDLDTARMEAMVNQALYRQRRSDNLPHSHQQ